MLFTLEALQAQKGDCLILHFGEADAPRFIVIDGGPNPVYQTSLKPRLEQLRSRWAEDEPLPIDMVMVSHIDDDHINGIDQWFHELKDLSDDGAPLSEDIRTLWFNSFDDVLGNASEELQSKLASVASVAVASGDGKPFNDDPELGRQSAAVVASIPQGRALRSLANSLAISLNVPFRGLIMPSQAKSRAVSMGSGLRFHVLGPTREQVEKLQKDWDENVRKHPEDQARVAAFADRSVANLSSIIVLAEMEGEDGVKRMLLTGDARGDHIWDGLIGGGFIKDRDDSLHLNLIKMPHHGSNRNMREDFLQKITADHYVISANGENKNPDVDIFQWLAVARGNDRYTVWLTNEKMFEPQKKIDIGKEVKEALAANPSPGRRVVFRNEGDVSVKVDLFEAVDY